ncbi:NACHT and ankyrin domain protein [Colletotrichum sojae]|uniref:NACHT and ankyrin domain protein n=1 Tax=Colletotrichum sojae TaxID=2175907 RepID=A0A8H6MTJ5_9PEZI|nr:NACHT and ankyrin domain protein [Colletotrichum sojae]
MAPRSLMSLDSPDAYTVGWIAALPIERAAAKAILDEEHAEPNGLIRHPSDTNVYTWGRIGEHNVVIASLAAGIYGLTSAATTASSLSASLPSIRIGLLVGIGGAIPRPDDDRDIRLGDVVVSQPDGTTGGVCQYDLVKAKPGDRRERKGFLAMPPTVLLKALSSIQADHEIEDSKIPDILQDMLQANPKMAKRSKQSPGYVHQGADNDRLFQFSYEHVSGNNCGSCEADEEVQRDPRDSTDPEIHYGIIASGNTLVKDGIARDRIVADVGEDCICFEMEAAGLINHFPCLVVRGICDYADSHKNDRWQRYASATAAAYAKELLAYVLTSEVQESRRVVEILKSVEQKTEDTHKTAIEMKATLESQGRASLRKGVLKWLAAPDSSTNANHARKLRHEGTGSWLLENAKFKDWTLGLHKHLWLCGIPGCGKTVLSTIVLDHLSRDDGQIILSFFFTFSEPEKQTADGMLRSIAFQLYQGGFDSHGQLENSLEVHKDGETKPTTDTLQDVVCRILAPHRRVFVILDALDESTNRSRVLTWIHHLFCSPELGHVQVLYTSREEADFIQFLPGLIGAECVLNMDQKAVDIDIVSYVTAKLRCDLRFTDKNLSQDLIEQIREKPLTLQEAVEVIATDFEEEPPRFSIDCRLFRETDILRHCPNLVSVVEVKNAWSRTVQELHLAHFSVKEYLLLQISFEQTNACIAITRTFLAYLRDIWHDTECVSGYEFPLAPCAARELLSFAKVAESSAKISSELVASLGEKKFFNRWRSLVHHEKTTRWDWFQDLPWGPSLHYASIGGLTAVAKSIIENGADVNARSYAFGNAFQAAVTHGQLDTVKLLLDNNADTNTQGRSESFSALHYACENGHVGIAELLLERGAKFKRRGLSYADALRSASANGHIGVVQLLLEKRQNPAIRGAAGEYNSALQAASFGGHEDIAKMLLDVGANANARDEANVTPLYAAVIFRLLVAYGADLSTLVDDYELRLNERCERCDSVGVEILLDLVADVNSRSSEFDIILQTTASSVAEGALRVSLVDADTNFSAHGGVDTNDVYAVQRAIVWMSGGEQPVEVLIKLGAAISNGGTYDAKFRPVLPRMSFAPIAALVQLGHEALASGSMDPRLVASYEGLRNIVMWLLRKRCETRGPLLEERSLISKSTPGDGWTPLLMACERGLAGVVSLLIERPGVDLNSRDFQNGQTGLSFAAEYGHQEIVERLLLEARLDLDLPDRAARTALFHAARKGHDAIVEALLGRGSAANIPDSFFRFHSALSSG